MPAAHPHRARLEVRDEGIGIQPEAMGRIFNRFERAATGWNTRTGTLTPTLSRGEREE